MRSVTAHEEPDRHGVAPMTSETGRDEPAGPPILHPGEEVDGHSRGAVLASGALGALMVVLAVVVGADAASLDNRGGPVGPAAVPALVAVLLAVAGVLLVAKARRDLRRCGVPASAATPFPAGRLLRLAAMVGLLVGFALLLPVLGYVVMSTVLFTGAALLLGAPSPARTLAYGWTLAAVVFLVFDRLIGLTLPAGPWGF